MTPLFIKHTEFTPDITFDPEKGQFEIKGVSRPENVIEFYEKPIAWLKEFELAIINGSLQVHSLKMVFEMTYFNSATSKSFLQMMETLTSLQEYGLTLDVDWYYDPNDDQMLDDGEDLSDTIDLTFNFIEMD